MGYRGYRREELQCTTTSVLERNRFVSITKATNTAAYSTYGSVVDGIVSHRSTSESVSVYPINSLLRTSLIQIARAVIKGSYLFPVADGKAVSSEYTASTRAVAAEPTLSANATYLLPATVTGDNWATHGNAVGVYTHATTSWAFVDVSATVNLGLTIYLSNEKRYVSWNGTAWVTAVPAAIANETGSVGNEIECYNLNDFKIASLPANLVYAAPIVGQYSGTPGAASVTILDARIEAGDLVICTVQAYTNASYILKAVCTAGTLTVTFNTDPGASTKFTYAIIRAI